MVLNTPLNIGIIPGRHTSISLTGMLVRAHISTTQKNRMALDSNLNRQNSPKFKPKKIEGLKMQTAKKWLPKINFSVAIS